MAERSLRRRMAIATLVVALPVASVAAGSGGAGAITGGPGAPVTLPATDTPMWQTNDAVWALAYSNGILFAGGDFTSIRPPGAAKGTGEVPMRRLAAFNAATGVPCRTAADCNGFVWRDPAIGTTTPGAPNRVWALSVTPDGSKLFAGGDMAGKVMGYHLTSAGATRIAWTTGVSGQVRALASSNTELYVGGQITAPNAKAASFAIPASGAPTFRSEWRPTFTSPTNSPSYVNALLVGPRPDAVVVGGTFRTVNGVAQSGITQLYRSNAQVLPSGQGRMSNTLITGVSYNAEGEQNRSDVKTLITDGTNVFVGAEGSGYGLFDGQASVNPNNGVVNWRSNCLGATQALAAIGPTLYIGSHTHDCTRLATGGMGQTPFANDATSWHHLLAQVKDGNGGTGGSPLRSWFPATNASPNVPVGANELGPRAMATDGTNLWVGGQFSQVNGRGQQGLTSFRPEGAGARPLAAKTYAVSPSPGNVTVRWTGSSDPDDKYLTYTLLRDGAPIATVGPQDSPWWQAPLYVFRDTNVPAGSHSYAVQVTDEHGLNPTGNPSAVTVAGPTGTYQEKVLANAPSFYWRMGEPSGTTVADSSGRNVSGVARRGVTRGQQGAIAGNGATATATNALVSPASNTAVLPPAAITMEAWVRTAPGQKGGGRIIGWGNKNPTGTGSTTNPNLSTTPDRVLYMQNGGQLTFSIFTKNADNTCRSTNRYAQRGTCYVWSNKSYNDGSWHHVVATQDATAIRLYVDGVQVGGQALTADQTPRATAPGFWRVGVDTMTGLAFVPANKALPGAIDEVAVYPTALDAATVAGHFRGAE